LLKLNADRREFSRYSNGQTTRIFEDAEGVIWVGTRTSGVLRFPEKSLAFVNYRRQVNQPPGLRNNEIQSVGIDSQGDLWTGTASGLERLDRKTGQLNLYQHDSKNPWSLSNSPVFATAEDRLGRLWFGTYGAGLDRFDRATGRFFAWRHDPKNPDSLSTDLILCMLVDHEGILWVGTQDGGLDRYDPVTGKFNLYLPGARISALSEDHTGALWVGTNTGWLARFDRKSGQFTAYHHDPKEPGGLGNESIEVIHQDRRGTLWIGTRDGLYRLDPSGNFTRFTTKDGLPDLYVKAILEDRRGDLWLATHNGLSHFSPQTREFRNYFESDGLPGNNFNLLGEAASRAPDGEMVFGSSNGVSLFDPDKLSPNPYVPPVVLTDLLLFNKPLRPGGNSPLQKPIWATDSLILNHNQNIFTLEFAALSYADPDQNRYRYRLEGLETDWNEVDSSRRVATYTNLAAKRYVLRVQGSNNDLVWNNAGVSLAITILPPWWETAWFRMALALCIAGLIATAHQLRMRALRSTAARLQFEVRERTRELKTAKDSAETARDAAENANRAKSAFLSLMSHELRTPLNAILGFARLLRGDAASEKQRADLDIISRSGEHLLVLINELLDLARIEAGRGTAEIAPCDLKRLVRDVIDMMRVRALEKNLELRVVESPAFPRFVETDAPKVRQMLINLLGNAIKYTERGSVTLRLSAQSGADAARMLLNFEVEDTGIGIAGEDQERIFEPFVQVGKTRQKGTGLGLAITRQYAVLLEGSIRVASAPGEGSRFQLELPATPAEPFATDSGDAERKYVLDAGQPEYRILVVDDEPENRQLLQRLLQEAGFQARIAEDGQQAVEIFQIWRPHFIWMDLRMAGVNGAEAARRIRELEGGREVKIAAVTASENTRVVKDMDDFIRKPYGMNEIFECMARHLGLSYRSDFADQPLSVEFPAALRPEALAAIPEDLRAELTNAVLTLDINRITPAIRRIAELDPPLGSALMFHLQRRTFTEVWNALRDAKSVKP
jgi:signal transduction histidine kinase/CheY-like chemotaxis protein/streptogramin lyase